MCSSLSASQLVWFCWYSCIFFSLISTVDFISHMPLINWIGNYFSSCFTVYFNWETVFKLHGGWLETTLTSTVAEATMAHASWPHIQGNKVRFSVSQLLTWAFFPTSSHFLATAMLLESQWLTRYQTISLEPSRTACHGAPDGSLLHRWLIRTSSYNLLFCSLFSWVYFRERESPDHMIDVSSLLTQALGNESL
jgi:hypothetical protein